MTREMSPAEAETWCRCCCDPAARVDRDGVLNTACPHIRMPLSERPKPNTTKNEKEQTS